MLDDKKRAELDQCRAAVGELLPAMCWELYQRFIENGFTVEQSFTLTRDYLRSTVYAAKPDMEGE